MKLRILATLFLTALLATGLVAVQMRVDAVRGEMAVQAPELYLSSASWVKRLAFGYDGLLACLYWTRAVQHYGRERLTRKRYNLLDGLLDITTTLDPDLLLAYRFGSVFLSADYPDGPGLKGEAVRLLKKGIRHKPGYWEFRFDLGFLYYRVFKDSIRAAAVFQEASELPGAPPWLKLLATSVAGEAGGRDTAVFLWTQLYQSTDDPSLRLAALVHLNNLRAEADVEFLESVVERYRTAAGRFPRGWAELTAAGLLPGAPADPLGSPYVLGAEGKVLLKFESRVTSLNLGRAEKE